MHSVARNGPIAGLVLMLLAPLDCWAVAAVVGVSATAAAVDGAATQRLVVGQPAPEISFPSLRPGGDPIRLSEHTGKVVYLDFWSAWCAPCRRAMPHLDALREEFSRHDFEVIGVNVDVLATDARRFLEQVSVSYPVGRDPGGGMSSSLGVTALPALFLIDREGVVRDAIRGSGVEATEELRTRLSTLIETGEVQ